jgi:hypothetical protein
MSNVIGARAPGWFRLVALLALLWNLVGVYFYLVHVHLVAGPAASPAEAAIGEAMPSWATACFAVGVFAGTLGALGLAMLKDWSRLLLWLSLLALIAEQAWLVLLSGAPQVLGPSAYGLPATILVVAALLVWLAGSAAKKGWLS